MLHLKRAISPVQFKCMTSIIRHHQVTVLGGANEIGQTLCLLLRAQPAITKLVVYDTQPQTPGVILDLSHIPSETLVQGYQGEDTLDRALKNSDLVLVTGGVVFRPGLSKKTVFALNAKFMKSVTARIAKLYPMPFVGIVTEPINRLVPLAAEVMRNNGEYDAKKLFGVTGVDLLRAQAIFAAENNLHPRDCFIPVIGGHSENTLLPLLSQVKPKMTLNDRVIQEFVTKLRLCDEIVIRGKKGWSPTLSVAYNVLLFTQSILNVFDGFPTKLNAFIDNNDFGTSYFSGLVTVDKDGAGEMDRYTDLTQYECHLLERCIVQLRKDILKGKKILEPG